MAKAVPIKNSCLVAPIYLRCHRGEYIIKGHTFINIQSSSRYELVKMLMVEGNFQECFKGFGTTKVQKGTFKKEFITPQQY